MMIRPIIFDARASKIFFLTMWWWLHTPDAPATNLLFFNSYRQLEYVFHHVTAPEGDPPPWKIEPIKPDYKDATHLLHYYQITFFGERFTVIFYNADLAQTVEEDAAMRAFFHSMFHRQQPVIRSATTYPSGRQRD